MEPLASCGLTILLKVFVEFPIKVGYFVFSKGQQAEFVNVCW